MPDDERINDQEATQRHDLPGEPPRSPLIRAAGESGTPSVGDPGQPGSDVGRYSPPSEQRQLQALVRRVEALQAMRQSERNRLALETADSPIVASLRQHLAQLDQLLDQLH